jgi:beta-glucosidase-like glycosyl hydrolase
MDTLTAGVKLERLIGERISGSCRGHTPTPDLLDLNRRDLIGGVILLARHIRDREQTAALTRALQSAARTMGQPAPRLVMTDQENGSVRRPGTDSAQFPGAMALGAIHAADAGADERIVEAPGALRWRGRWTGRSPWRRICPWTQGRDDHRSA